MYIENDWGSEEYCS